MHRVSVLREESGAPTALWTVWRTHQHDIEGTRGVDAEQRMDRGAERTAYSASVFACALLGLAVREQRRFRLMLWVAALLGAQSLLYGFVTPDAAALSTVASAWMPAVLTAAGA